MGIVLIELWNPVVVEGFDENSLSGLFAIPVSLIPTGTESTGHTTHKHCVVLC